MRQASRGSGPPKPWQRLEAGRHRSSDGRFTLESDGAGRWFVSDAEALDDLGLARTTGPFPTLDAAKAAADLARTEPAAPSPLAALAPTTVRSLPTATPSGPASPPVGPAPPGARTPPPPPRRSWIDELADRDPDAAGHARRLVTALGREHVPDADAVVRRDVLGDRPAVATRLLARDVLEAVAALHDPTTATVIETIAGVIAASRTRPGLPGWELVERDGATGRRRPIRLTAEDLADAAGGKRPGA